MNLKNQPVPSAGRMDMKTPPTIEQTQFLHKLYCGVTDQDIPFSMARHYVYERFMAAGYDKAELEVVVRYIKRKIKAGARYPESLMFRNLIQNIDRFAEDLSMARGEERAIKDRQDTPRKEILRAANINLDPKRDNTVRSAAQVLAGMEALKKLRQLKETL
jgi:hypothetical protein